MIAVYEDYIGDLLVFGGIAASFLSLIIMVKFMKGEKENPLKAEALHIFKFVDDLPLPTLLYMSATVLILIGTSSFFEKENYFISMGYALILFATVYLSIKWLWCVFVEKLIKILKEHQYF